MAETKFTDEEIKAHFKHQCEAGMDPILCLRRSWHVMNLMGKELPTTIEQFEKLQKEAVDKHKIEFIDRIITEDRYVELIRYGEVEKLDDIVILNPYSFHQVLNPAEYDCASAIFWLYPSGCQTLGQLFRKYSAKIKIVLMGKS